MRRSSPSGSRPVVTAITACSEPTIRIDLAEPPSTVEPEQYYRLRFRPDEAMTLEEAEAELTRNLLAASARINVWLRWG